MRTLTLAVAVSLLLAPATRTAAQDSTAPASPPVVATGQQQNPPAAVGEEAAKPRGSFFSSLGHNLADDVKHIPRRNSVYWLAGGIAAADAIHPADKTLNARLLGHSNPFVLGDYIGSPLTIGAAGMAPSPLGRRSNAPRAQHLAIAQV